jgi:hypothetical protein
VACGADWKPQKAFFTSFFARRFAAAAVCTAHTNNTDIDLEQQTDILQYPISFFHIINQQNSLYYTK